MLRNIRIARGTKAMSDSLELHRLEPGNFSLVTDAPELRFHDGKTQGGIVIPIPAELHSTIMDIYYPERLELTPATTS